MKSVKKNGLTIHPISTDTKLSLPFVGAIKAGFPSPAQDYMGDTIDLNKLLIKNKASTFLAKADGNSLIKKIANGDIMIIDRSLEAHDGSTVVCFIDGEFTTKTVSIVSKDEVLLLPENDDFPVIRVTEENQFIIWGVVTYSIKKHI